VLRTDRNTLFLVVVSVVWLGDPGVLWNLGFLLFFFWGVGAVVG
jgi:hypothetical protein